MENTEDTSNLEAQTTVAGTKRVEPIVLKGPTNIFGSDRETYDLSPVNQQPVFTTQALRSGHLPILPKAGLDYLNGLESIHIYQTFELNEALTGVNSENRFTVRGPYNEALFVASEQSDASEQMWWGASRRFALQFLDKTHQESLILERIPDSGLICCCRKERLFLIVPPNDVVGVIEQEFSLSEVVLLLKNSHSETLFKVSVPKTCMGCSNQKEINVRVMSGGGLTQKGTISRTWNADISHFCMNVYFVDTEMHSRLKSLMMGAAFLLDYMLFQKSTGCC